MFKERLKALRKEAGLTQKDMARNFGTSQPSYQQWESGKRTPNSDNLEKLANFFNVSTDYLIGLSDTKTTAQAIEIPNTSTFAQRLKALRKEAGLTQKEIAEQLGIKQPTYAQWENGRVKPKAETLEKFSNFFNVSTDYLLGHTDIKTTPSDTDLLTLLNTESASFDGKPLTEHNKEILLKVARGLFDGKLQ